MLFHILRIVDGGTGKSVFKRYETTSSVVERPATPNGDGTIALVFTDQSEDLGQSDLNAWLEQVSGPRLDLLYRGLQLIWKANRVLAHGPEHLREPMFEAVRRFAVLQRAVGDLENAADSLAEAVGQLVTIHEMRRPLAAMRRQAAEVSQAHLFALSLKLPVELPQATGAADPAMRMRAELSSQAMLAERLDLAIHRLEVIEEQFDRVLEQTLESKRAGTEAVVGAIIVVLLTAELLISFGLVKFG